MEQMGLLEPAMNRTVEFPSMRREVMRALAALSDPDYQAAVWIDENYPHPGFYDAFSETVHALFDDQGVLPDPEASVGTILLSGSEVVRLFELGRLLDHLLDSHDRGTSDVAYLEDPSWPLIVAAAGLALSAMVLAGAFSD